MKQILIVVFSQIVKDLVRPEGIVEDLIVELEVIMITMSDSDPVITLPSDSELKEKLQRKLEEYGTRILTYQPPRLQMDTVCKMIILERLLCEGWVDTRELSMEMARIFGSGFDPRAFTNACGVIKDYCKTGGQKNPGLW